MQQFCNIIQHVQSQTIKISTPRVFLVVWRCRCPFLNHDYAQVEKSQQLEDSNCGETEFLILLPS